MAKPATDRYNTRYHKLVIKEREEIYERLLQQRFTNLQDLKLLEVGAGYGGNLQFFNKIGFSAHNLFANELLPGRGEIIRHKVPGITIFEGDAMLLNSEDIPPQDIIFQSTMFTSVLDDNKKKQIADALWKLLKPGGIFLWYDFVYNNPKNPNVKGINKSEICRLFPGAVTKKFYPVSLAPPIGRTFPKLYKLLNALPFLRSHLIAVIEK